jgi:ATP-dependent Clp protease ATP-binding subunit ClpA
VPWNTVGSATEHLLLGVASDRDGLAARILADAGVSFEELREAVAGTVGRGGAYRDADALAAIGIDLAAVREAIESTFGRGALEPTRAGYVPFTPRAKKALEIARREARALGHDYVGTEHLLLGLASSEGLAREVLAQRGLQRKRLRALVVETVAA